MGISDLVKNGVFEYTNKLNAFEAGKGSIKDNMDDLCEILECEIIKSKSSDEEKQKLLKRLREFCNTETNIMLVGATGCGKSSTINALFSAKNNNDAVSNKKDESEDIDDVSAENEEQQSNIGAKYVEVAKVGSKSDPETKDIEKYKIGNLVLWDTPGLGDGTEIDEHHKSVITDLLEEQDENGNKLIDMVLLILDGSTRDLGTSYKLVNEVILPELKDESNRLIVALNQADIAMKTGRHWDYEKNEPDETLITFLDDKVDSIRKRFKEDSDIDINPIYYCAGYQEESGETVYPYNLSKLLYYILNSLPSEKRVAVMEGVKMDSDNYIHNDSDGDYNKKIKDSFYDSFDYISDGVDKGADIGVMVLGLPGAIVGAFLGGFVGCVREIVEEVF